MTGSVTVRTTNTGLALHDGPSVLGERQVRIPTSGKIRGGIKVLTAAAAQHEKAKPIYDAGVASGESWDAIEKKLIATCGFQRSPLTPRNVPYFTVRPGDFSMPEVADMIMERYGEDRGDGRHLYRFPVIFPMDSWLSCMPHGFQHHTRSQMVHWSEYGPDGTRFCKQRAPVDMDPTTKQAVRTFGGRQVILRPENGGICDPNKCPEYRKKECNLTGSILFYLPNIPGSSAIELRTNSIYSLKQARETMEMVAFLRGGKISGLMDGKPIFYITKRHEEVAMIDPSTGNPKKVKQWLIAIEADVDMTSVFVSADQQALLESGERAAADLGHGDDDDDHVTFDKATGEVLSVERTEPEPKGRQEGPVAGNDPDPAQTADNAGIKKMRAQVAEMLTAYGIAAEVFGKYGTSKWGPEWSRQVETLRSAGAELLAAKDDPEAYIKARALDTPF